MDDYGLVSIITPSYNSAQFISSTIEAILAQTYQHWELLITDDCSTDNSVEIIRKYGIVIHINDLLQFFMERLILIENTVQNRIRMFLALFRYDKAFVKG